jgi:hypothetical protein
MVQSPTLTWLLKLELIYSTENFQCAIIEASTVKSIFAILRSHNLYTQTSAAYLVGRIVCHGMISYSHLIVKLS